MKFLLCLLWIHSLSSAIHVIGDSHVREFTGIPGCVLHHLGPILMHRIGRDGLKAVNLVNLGVQEGDTAVYATGEIDIRCHVLKQRDMKGRLLEEILDGLADRYIQTILSNRQQYRSLHCIVYNVIPPLRSGAFNPEYPVYGSIEDRVAAAKLLNAILKQKCEEQGIAFLDVYDAYSEGDGSLSVPYSDGNVHIHSNFNIPIQQRLRELVPFEFP